MSSSKQQLISSTQIILAGALFLLLTGNMSYFGKVLETYPWNSDNAGFLVSVIVVLACEITLVISLLSLLIPARVTVSLLLLLSALTAYFSDAFGVVIDTVMIRNTLQTNPAEMADLINLSFLLRLLLLGLAPIALLWYLPLRPESYWRRSRKQLLLVLVSIVTALLSMALFSSQYASFIRVHKAFRYYANPIFPLYSAGKYLVKAGVDSSPHPLVQLAPEATISKSDPDYELTIMVVGEAARRDRFSLNGYSRNTNPELSGESRVFSYTHISSCGTSTSVSVPCMFALSGRKDYDSSEDGNTQNVLDVLQRAGVSVLWRDNNSSSQGVADRVQYEDFRTPDKNPECDDECRDVGMLSGLQDYIDTHSGDILIVLHQMGNHGPAYYKRYPAEYKRFTPACRSVELSECTDAEIGNAYDNAIGYTDYFLSQVIALLKANTPAYETAMLYVSDHGESLGENDLYLHGLPYALAPKEQTDIPVILWLGESSDIDVHSVLTRLEKKNSQDAVFQTLLTIYEVKTELPSIPPGLFETKESD